MTQSYLQGLEEHWGQMYEGMAKDASGGLLQEPANTLSLMSSGCLWERQWSQTCKTGAPCQGKQDIVLLGTMSIAIWASLTFSYVCFPFP